MDRGLVVRGGYAAEKPPPAPAPVPFRSLGYRFRRRGHERLHLSVRHPSPIITHRSTAYFEPRYNVNKDLQLYIGTSTESISFAKPGLPLKSTSMVVSGRPSAPLRSTFGVWGYPVIRAGSAPINVLTRRHFPAAMFAASAPTRSSLPMANVMKKDVSFFEGYAKLKLHHQRQLAGRI